jgi:hypothetical protein
MKKFLISLLALTVLGGVVNANAATRIELNGPDMGVRMVENQELLTDGPSLMAMTQTNDGDRFYLCKTLDDAICTNGHNLRATSFLPPCAGDISVNCIAAFYAVSESGERIEGKFQRLVAQGTEREYPANPKYNLPQGVGQGSIWTIPGLKNGAGNEDYYIGARFDSWAQFGGGRIFSNFYPSRMITGIVPVSTKLGSFGVTVPLDSNNPSQDGSPNGGVGSRNSSDDQTWKDCAVTEIGKCYMATDFPAEYRFGLTLKLGATLKGWFHGRIYRPVITVKTESAGGAEEITVEALPVTVPTIEEKVPTSEIPAVLRDYLRNHEVSNGFGYVMPEASQPTSFEHAKLWLPVIKDKASKSLTYWSVRTLDQINDPVIANCTKSDGALSGVVTTNSLVYNAGPPEFDKTTQNLNYKVLSTHYAADGSIAKGTYDLILSSSVARCIYGFTKAPIQASLSILSEDGSPQVATQTINEKNGWLTLSANGFSYSSPTIAVKLSQEATASSPSATSKSPSWAQGTKTITCSKGKLKKKVSGFNPKCPSGYKKAA